MVRLFDLCSSAFGLALLSPLFLLVALAIKLDGPGPVFYRQERIGRWGRPFKILKFRTMSTGADRSGPLLTVGGDSRITRVGRWLRRWKLDELPQLVNVVRGEMGLVGPRPEVPRYVALYTEEQARVLSLRPGVTDPASIAYRNENEILSAAGDPEAFYVENVLPNKVRINLEYAAEASLGSNLQVILATLGLLEPKVRVRKPGDRRAFDRLVFPRPVNVSAALAVHGGVPVRVADLSQGGILLEAGAALPPGQPCQVELPLGERTVVAQGTILRADGKGTAVRFAKPLDSRIWRSMEDKDGPTHDLDRK